MPTDFDEVIREISVSQGLVSEASVAGAWQRLLELERTGQAIPLSLVLERLQMIQPADRLALENAARYRVTRDVDKEIARILQDSNYCKQDSINQALAAQKDHYRATRETLRLATWLVERGLLNDAQRIAAEKLFALGNKA